MADTVPKVCLSARRLAKNGGYTPEEARKIAARTILYQHLTEAIGGIHGDKALVRD